MKQLFLFIALTAMLQNSFAQENSRFTGMWQGSLEGPDLRIVFRIKTNDKGELIAKADSPDQVAFGLKCDSLYTNNDHITIEMRDLKAIFKGKLVNDSTIEGDFIQSGSYVLNLHKTEKVSPPKKKNRPQEPKPPFPYYSYDVEYDNADKSIHYGATFTVPIADSNIRYIKSPVYPVIIMITGSGQQDRNESLMGHKPFWVIADHLSRRGYAVLRIDDRGVGKTTGNFSKSTSEDFAKDIEAAIDYILTRTETDKSKIGLMGHSEGGMIAPMVATRRREVSFIVLLAGPGVKIIDLMKEQNAAILRASGIQEYAIQKYKPVYEHIVMDIVNAPDTTTARIHATEALEHWMKRADSLTISQLGFKDEKDKDSYIKLMISGVNTPWYKYFINFDPKPYLRKLHCKVLALNGSMDIQVISSQNLSGIKKALKKSDSPMYMVKELPGLNHLFQQCKTCTLAEYGQLEETFSPIALKAITEWLDLNVK